MLCGSAFASTIEYVTNLIYQLMKAIQSLIYAFSGINIFAKATASSMKNTSKSAKDTNKSLSSVHSEINNVSEKDSSGSGDISPNIDLSKVDNMSNSILDAIKNKDWSLVGSLIGEKLNRGLNSIPWNKIQNTTRNIAKNIAGFLNGFIGTADWNTVGNTLAQGLNTTIYFGYEFVTTFDWKQFGKAIGDSINGFFKNVDWKTAGKTLGEGIKGALNTISTALQEIDWQQIAKSIEEFITNIDWKGVTQALFTGLGSALGGLTAFLGTLIADAFTGIGDYFNEKIEECGGDIVLGILKGIGDAITGIGQWIYENIFQPFINGFKNAFGIHSPSTVMAEMGGYIIQGLLNGITSLVNKVKDIWNNVKNTTVNIWNTIKDKVKEGAQGAWDGITSVFGNVSGWFKDKFSQAWEAVKNVFSKGGAVFDGIKDGILNGLKTVINAIIKGINKVISIPFNGLNTALKKIREVSIFDFKPFSWISTISVPQIPELAKGGVLYDESIVKVAEYSGAGNNPEIVTPQNIMYDTMRRALSDSDIGTDNDKPIYLTVNVGNTKLGQILLDNLKDMKRQTGKDIEALVGG